MTGTFKKPVRFPLTGPINVTDYDAYVKKSNTEFLNLMDLQWVEDANFGDFQVKKHIANGAFGTVSLVCHKKDDNLFAMKALDKARIVKTKQMDNAKREMLVLQCITYPFAVYLEHYFKDNKNLYFILPFITGGELYHQLVNLGKFEEHQARFYGAQVILAIEYLHTLDMIHRDIKPENLLIDNTGYLKLADFGFTKMVKTRTYTTCGTPEYMAPEIIVHKGYSKAVDWWAVGILMYEMVAGRTPFYHKRIMKMYQNIVSGQYDTPEYFTEDLQDLIKNLLQVDLSRRFGNLVNGTNDIKGHKWFRSIEWLTLFNRKMNAPIIPEDITEGDDYKNVNTLFKDSTLDSFKGDLLRF